MTLIPVDKFSSRRGQRVRLVVIHTSEGARTVESLAAYLRRPGVNASYHGAVDDDRFAQYVDYGNAAWHLRSGNPMSDGLCLCAFAGWSRTEWLGHPRMLELTAAWIAERCLARQVPVLLLTSQQTGAAVRERNHPGGVADHHRYTQGTGDGTHWDVGPNFPFDTVIPRAQQIARGITPPPPARHSFREDETMYIRTPAGTGTRKQDWPTQRVHIGFNPPGGWGGRMVLNLHFGFPGGWVHEAQWWVRQGTGITGFANRPHNPVPLTFDAVAGRERFGGLGWQLSPPERADELEVLISAPGGVHIFPFYEH